MHSKTQKYKYFTFQNCFSDIIFLTVLTYHATDSDPLAPPINF